MLIKIIIGIAIGFFGSIAMWQEAFNNVGNNNNGTLQGIIGVFFLISIIFIVSSFLYGGIYGLMAIGEISFGYFIGYKITFKDYP